MHHCNTFGELTSPPAVALVAEAGIFVVDPDVHGRMIGCPHSAVPQRVSAGERSTDAQRPEDQGVSVWPDEPPLSRAPEQAVVEELLARAAAHPSVNELVSGDHPASGIHQSQDLALVHGRIVARFWGGGR